MPTTPPPPPKSKIVGGPEDAPGQIVITPDGVVHVADATGALEPPIVVPDPIGDLMRERSPYGNPYQAPPVAPPSTLLERWRSWTGTTPPPPPPPALAALRPGPSSSASPRAMGARLELLDAVIEDGGRAAVDRVTGARWTVRTFPTADQAGVVVAAGALYRLAGVAAPAARLVELPGDARPAVAWPRLAAWFPLGQAADLAEDLAAELPADVWIGNTRAPSAIKGRAVRLEGTASLVRWDLTGCLVYQAHGRTDPTFAPGDVSQLRDALELEAYAAGRARPALLLPMAERLAVITEDQVRQALELGRLAPERVAVLSAALLARRSLVALSVRGLKPR